MSSKRYNGSQAKSAMFEGHVDRSDGGLIEGWAWNAANPSEPVLLEVIGINHECLTYVLCDRYRHDLYVNGKGNGAHGFQVALKEEWIPLEPLRLLIAGTSFELTGSPVCSINCRPLQPARIDSTNYRIFNSGNQFCSDFKEPKRIQIGTLTGKQTDPKSRTREVDKQLQLVTDYKAANETIIDNDSNLLANQDVATLWFGLIPWDFRNQRPQQLCTELVNLGENVCYVEPEFNAITTSVRSISSSGGKKLSVLKLTVPAPHPHPITLPMSQETALSLADQIVKVFKFANETRQKRIVAIVNSPFWLPVLRHLNRCFEKIIYDCMDYYQGFEGYAEQFPDDEKILVSMSDVVTTSSVPLAQLLRKKGGRHKVVQVSNAWRSELATVARSPYFFGKRSEPVIGYVGAIENWFDESLIKNLADEFPSLQFVLAGRTIPSMQKKLCNIPNITLLGELHASKLANFLAHIDIGIIPFLDVAITKYVQPVKLYEYLVTGRPVISTRFGELLGFSGVHYVSGAASAKEKINELTTNRRKTRTEIQRSRIELAGHSWRTRASTILDLY